MKKSVLTLILIATSLNFVSAQTLTVLSTPDDTYGLLITCMSHDGHWVGGTTYAAQMFVADWANDSITHSSEASDVYGAYINGISNSGLGVGYDGPAVSYDIEGTRTVIQADENSAYYIAYGITDDDSTIVGCRVTNSYIQNACYWKNGELTMLPMATSSEIGFSISGSCATHISADGSIILGYVVDMKSTYPAVLWRWTDDGYALDTICKGMFHPQTDDENGNVIDSGEPYTTFSSVNMSENGKYVLLSVAEALSIDSVFYKNTLFLWMAVTSGEQKAAIYDTETEELTIFTVDGSTGIDSLTALQPYAIANDGTIVGFNSDYSERYGFIIPAGQTQPILLTDYFPTLDLSTWQNDTYNYNCPAAISADGRYIAGFGLDNAYSLYESWIIDTQGVASDDEGSDDEESDEESGIKLLSASGTETTVRTYFSVDGRRMNTPAKGLNILRMSDGTTKKVVIK